MKKYSILSKRSFYLLIAPLLILSLCILGCNKKKDTGGTNNTKNPTNPVSNTGTFTFKGISYTGTCSVIPDDTSLGFQWSMSISDDSKDAALVIGLFPQEATGVFGICANSNGPGRNGIIRLGSSDIYSIKFGKITKLSKTKFKIEGSAYADLSTVPIPFTAEGDILDLTNRFDHPTMNPYPAGRSPVSIYTDKPLNGDTLYIYILDATNNEFVDYAGLLTYHHPDVYRCGESESFSFLEPGTYKYETSSSIPGSKPITGSFSVQANTCNSVRLNR